MTSDPASALERSPWPALWALVIGFFMILVDTTIVSVANPAIKTALDPASPNLDNVVWVTSAYLLAYAVPLLVSGRLGDRFGPKNIYLVGLAVFTLSSLLCGMADDLATLIWMRALQGLGAALMTPQTMAVITRTFPPSRRGAAMGLWGAVAGLATLVGPLAGGVLVQTWGWEWIFFINIPVGIVAFVAVVILVPRLQTHPHRFDLTGFALSAVGMFLIVFGFQEAAAFDWGVIWGPVSVWSLIVAGIVVMALFVWSQRRSRGEPLVPLSLFSDRNFSLSNAAIATVGFAMTSMPLPLMFFVQLGRGATPTESALLMVPMAVISGVLAPFAGRLLDRVDPRLLLVPGLATVTIAIAWYALLVAIGAELWWFLLPSALLGIGSAGMWGPLATTANRNLALEHAGAGSGVYNATRTVGSVIGSATVAALMQSRLADTMPQLTVSEAGAFADGSLPDALREPFSLAMSQTLLLPAAVLAAGAIMVCFVRGPRAPRARASAGSPS